MLSPDELIERAHAKGVNCLALTDHDEVQGVAAARIRGAELGVEVWAGIEISVSEENPKWRLHMLGLGIDPSNAALQTFLQKQRERRRNRGREIVEKLNRIGVELDYAAVETEAGDGSLGRPHIARALVKAGVCGHPNEAFTRFLRSGKPAFVASPGASAAEAIETIHGAGGIASLAHPPRSTGAEGPGGLNAFVSRLAHLGLDALEVYHPSHKAAQMRRMRRLVRDFDLVPTGGSDFHEARPPFTELGRTTGGALNQELCDQVRERIARQQAAASS